MSPGKTLETHEQQTHSTSNNPEVISYAQSTPFECIALGLPWTCALNQLMHMREVHMCCAILAKDAGI